MTALREILIEEEPVVTAAVTVTRTPAPKLYVVPTAKAPADRAEDSESRGQLTEEHSPVLRRAFPWLGLHRRPSVRRPRLSCRGGGARRSQDRSGADGRLGAEKCRDGDGHAFVGLAYVVFFPVIGLAMLAWSGVGQCWSRCATKS